jgi:hypothetical protein
MIGGYFFTEMMLNCKIKFSEHQGSFGKKNPHIFLTYKSNQIFPFFFTELIYLSLILFFKNYKTWIR